MTGVVTFDLDDRHCHVQLRGDRMTDVVTFDLEGIR